MMRLKITPHASAQDRQLGPCKMAPPLQQPINGTLDHSSPLAVLACMGTVECIGLREVLMLRGLLLRSGGGACRSRDLCR